MTDYVQLSTGHSPIDVKLSSSSSGLALENTNSDFRVRLNGLGLIGFALAIIAAATVLDGSASATRRLAAAEENLADVMACHWDMPQCVDHPDHDAWKASRKAKDDVARAERAKLLGFDTDEESKTKKMTGSGEN